MLLKNIKRMDSISYLIVAGAGLSIIVIGMGAWQAVMSRQETLQSQRETIDHLVENLSKADHIISSQQGTVEQLKEIAGDQQENLRRAEQIIESQRQGIEIQRKSIEENAYQNFKSGMVYNSEFEEIVREWFDRVKAAGINPPRYSKMIFIQPDDRTAAYQDYRTAPTRVSFDHETRVVIYAYRNRISIWRGLTHVLLGKGIDPIPDPKDYYDGEIPLGPDELMYNGFLYENYDTASEKEKDSYWGGMLDLYRVDLQQGP